MNRYHQCEGATAGRRGAHAGRRQGSRGHCPRRTQSEGPPGPRHADRAGCRLGTRRRVRQHDAQRATVVTVARRRGLDRDALLIRHPLTCARGPDVRPCVKQPRGAPPDAQREERAPGQIGVNRRHGRRSHPFSERGAFPVYRAPAQYLHFRQLARFDLGQAVRPAILCPAIRNERGAATRCTPFVRLPSGAVGQSPRS
jgi:hypothetical protein